MKKLIIILLAVILLAGGVGGYAYAQTMHQPVVGQKLIGFGALSVFFEAENNTAMYSRFLITNPDCVSQVTDIEILIIKDDGMEYTGVMVRPPSTPSPITVLAPHESGIVDLVSCVCPGENDPRNWPSGAYTVEISWKGSKGGLPLIGLSWMATATFNSITGDVTENVTTQAVSQMVNMTQVVTKSK